MNLKQIRQQNLKTQKEIAEEINTSQNTYSNYENGKTEPDISTLKKLADYFHTTIDYLVGHEVPYIIDKGLLSNEQLDVIEKIKSLDKEQCKLLATYIDGLKDGKKR